MIDRTQQIETLIKLVELNEDDTWLETFRSLRNGGYLPGGGAGSLNDWGPYFSGKFEDVWYGKLYEILRFLFDNNLGTNQIGEFAPIKSRSKIQIIRCLNCGKSYQHPRSFETQIALDFYQRYLPVFAENSSLIDILMPRRSFESDAAIEFRSLLKNQYSSKNIKIYDFVAAKYICPHCGIGVFKTVHDLYLIKENKHIELIKENADWADFQS